MVIEARTSNSIIPQLFSMKENQFKTVSLKQSFSNKTPHPKSQQTHPCIF